MGSVSKPRCVRGQSCVHVRQLCSDGPPTVAREGDLCERCLQAGPRIEEIAEEHRKLFHAAGAILNGDVTGEHVIVPTLILAAFAGVNATYKRISDRIVVAAYGKSQDWENLFKDFWKYLRSIEPYDVVNGVPLVRRPPIECVFAGDIDDNVESITVTVREPVKADEVAREYGDALSQCSLRYTTAKSIASKVEAKDDTLQIEVYPEQNPGVVHGHSGWRTRQGAFPAPKNVRALYEAFKGRKGFGPPGRGGGQAPQDQRLIAAVVAWYVGGRRAPAELSDQEKSERTRLISRHLLEPRGQPVKGISRLLESEKSEVIRKIESAEQDLFRPYHLLRTNI
jgi:hypothetical protein